MNKKVISTLFESSNIYPLLYPPVHASLINMTRSMRNSPFLRMPVVHRDNATPSLRLATGGSASLPY